MATDLQFINAAITRTGNDAITSLSQSGSAAAIATQNYEPFVRAKMSGYRWRWATKTAVLNLLPGTPPQPWGFAYQLPSDLLTLRTVTVFGKPIPYQRMFNKVFCNYGSDAEVVALYGWRPDEAYWPAWFAEPLTKNLEAMFLRGIGERHAEAAERDDAAKVEWAEARRIDAQSEPPTDPWTYPLLAARRA